MKSIEVSAKTIEEAIEEGLEKLGVSSDQVNVDVISNGGMFKKAKVKLTLKQDVAVPTVEKEPIKPEVVVPKKPVKSEPEPEKKQVKPVKDVSPVSPDSSEKLKACVEFVTKLLELLENPSTVTTQTTDKGYVIDISGEDVGRLIGKSGDALNALQTLVSSIAISNSNGEGKRVYVNIENYKEKRDETLNSLAQKKAEFVKRTGKYVKLDPMTPRDRAIIHTALQSIEGVRSYSTGEGKKRRLVIAPQRNDESKE